MSEIVKRTTDELYVISDFHEGKFGQIIDYIKGNILFKGQNYKYFASYLSSFDKDNLFEVCVPPEKDLAKYTFCIGIKICSDENQEDVEKLVGEIKAFILKQNKI